MPLDAASAPLLGVLPSVGGFRRRLAGSTPLPRRLGLRRDSRSEAEGPSGPIARTGFWLLLAGASLSLFSLLFAGGPSRDNAGVAATALAAYALALICLVVYDRLPVRAFHAISLGAIALVSLGLHFGGSDANYYRLFYAWIAVFAAYHFTVAAASLQLAAIGAAYGLVIVVDNVAVGPIAWILTLGTLAVMAIVTAQLKARIERQLRAAQAQNELLRENDRLKDEFLANVSHELRTPLTSIRGYLDLALEGDESELSPQVRGYLEVIDRNSERLLHQISDLLLVAQIEAHAMSIERRPVDVLAVAGGAVDRHVGAAAAHGIALSLEALPVPLVVGDAARLAQLLDVLLANALKFTPAGGSVWVRLRGLPGDRVEIEVADTGIGVPPDQQGRLFERFFRASGVSEQAVPGTGIGLTIAHGIVEAHGGSICCTSVEGAGSTFTVELPGRRA